METNNAVTPITRAHASEQAVAIELNGINYAVMMVSPQDLVEFAQGFLFTEQIISQAIDIHDIEQRPIDTDDFEGIVLKITLSNRSFHQFKDKIRLVKGGSGCGICGTTALKLAYQELAGNTDIQSVCIETFANLRSRVYQYQVYNQLSGAMHAAFLLTPDGEIVRCKEDIGRHNALDKLIGSMIAPNATYSDLSGFSIVITSRCSAELVLKVRAIGIKVLASFASPSDLALKLANNYNISLIHIPKKDAPIIYRPSNSKLLSGTAKAFSEGEPANE